MNHALVGLALWALQIAALYAWEFLGIEGAGNLLTAWIVVLFVLTLVTIFTLDTSKPYTKPKGLPKQITRSLSLAFVGAMVWFGHGWLAATFFVTAVLGMATHAVWAKEHAERQVAA
ncbi:hypothetical protein [Pseudorhodoferax sp. Leaf274]|uniref:hypothetical protein n=1 Tax=Pseudorhodoferax sp. Leaf274 TaxID=1736318 RepID=UPI00070324FD|nr:hypothetical protein [Pseudorhodoferax sp. Leaf274]KQP43927.1 hypothetical protein ASF44_28785 [Pseudorhodoferax sp. Leaf274]